MSQNPISERQQFWLDHIRAAVNGEQSQAEYARAHGLKVVSGVSIFFVAIVSN